VLQADSAPALPATSRGLAFHRVKKLVARLQGAKTRSCAAAGVFCGKTTECA
jgi:hypothetical protein